MKLTGEYISLGGRYKLVETTVSPATKMRFAWPWRPYQRRVLEALDAHLVDQRLHVVAAPGSGKTILGLEVIRRVGRPAVILSPTTTIRDQWLARLEHFVAAGTPIPPPWTSSDLSAPGFLTSVTYQALHTKYRGTPRGCDDQETTDADSVPDAEELSEVIQKLREACVGTLILDEAHHLRQEWWKALARVADALDGVTLVSLTATPPYDVVGLEWRRYEQLCGPIDEEIAVPELVRSGTLCPHQDYVWAVQLSKQGAQQIRDHDAQVERFTAQLLTDSELLRPIEAHAWIRAPEASAEAVLDAPEFAVSMLVYLQALGRPLPAGVLELLDTRAEELPALAKRWWQVLVEHYLYGDTWTPDEPREMHRDALAKRLRADGLLHRRELRLLRSRPIEAALSQAPDKIEACVSIHGLERRLRGADLRQVILTDFIRDDDLDTRELPVERQLGALPIFRALVGQIPTEQRAGVGLLTGRLVIIHHRHVAALCDVLEVTGTTPTIQPLTGALEDYFRVVSPGGSQLVGALTLLLSNGRLNVLVGTRALLGEGWDAPAVNSLILASYVGSYMLTNQMRGRAIRRNPAQADKIASVWHLVAVAPDTPSGWEDVTGLQRRFDAFVGVGAKRPVLESGLDRLELPEPRCPNWVADVNKEMERRLALHGDVPRRWETAIASGDVGRVLPSVRTATPPRMPPFMFYNTLRYLLASAVATFLTVYGGVMQSIRTESLRVVLWAMVAGGIAGLALSLPKLVRAATLALRHLPVDGSLRAIAMALYQALRDTGHISGGPATAEVRVKEVDSGAFAVSLADATFRDSAIYADCLSELLGPIENPRYLLTRPGTKWFKRRRDYHAVPQILGTRKELAAALHKAWRRRLGSGELIYTRTAEGRRTLLRARARAFSSSFVDTTQRVDRWQ